MTGSRLLTALTTPAPLYPAGDAATSPVPLWLGVLFGVLVVVSSFVVLLPRVRRALDRVWVKLPRRFRR